MLKDVPRIGAHSDMGASTCERWWNCPGSVHLIRRAPLAVPSQYAAEGTAAHTVAAIKLCQALDMPIPADIAQYVPKNGVWPDIDVDGFTFDVSEEMLDAVDVYVDYVLGTVEQYKLRPGYSVFVERRVSIPGVIIEGQESTDMFGTADAIGIVPYDMVIAIDYKHGKGVKVGVEKNKQTLFYATGAYFCLPEDVRIHLSKVRLVIVQPRAPGDAVKVIEYPIETLLNFYEELKTAALRVQPGAELVAGDHCKFCPARNGCPAMRNAIYDQAGIDFVEVAAPAVVPGKSLPEPASLSPEMLAKILDHTDVFKKWLTGCAEYARSVIEAGGVVPGYKVVEKIGNREWEDREAARKQLEPVLGAQTYSVPKLISFNQVKEAFKKLKKAGKILPNLDDIEALTVRKSRGFTLVPDDDQRDAAPPRAVQDFEGIGD